MVALAWRRASVGFRFRTSADVLNAAIDGVDAKIGRSVLALDDLWVGRSVCRFDSVVLEVLANCAVYRPDALHHPYAGIYRDWLFREFAEEQGGGLFTRSIALQFLRFKDA